MSPRFGLERLLLFVATLGPYLLMIGAREAWSLSPLTLGLPLQSSAIPYDSDTGPSFHPLAPFYVYPNGYKSIREIDFKNLTLYIFWKEGRPQRYNLRNGKCEVDRHPGHTSIELAGIHYLPSDTHEQRALVLYWVDSVGGSSGQFGIAQVFQLSDKRLRVTQQIDWDLHFGQSWLPFDSFDDKANSFVFPSAHYLPGDAHCCVSAIDVVTMTWKGSRFVQTNIRTELSDYGKNAGKKLPRAVPKSKH